MSLSEVLVFHQALKRPRYLTPQQIAEELNLNSIQDGHGGTETVGSEEISSLEKRAHKMFYKVWNGTVKHIKSVLSQQRKPIEVPGFAIFAPVIKAGPTIEDSPVTDHKSRPMKQRGAEISYLVGNARDFKRPEQQVKLIMHSDFLTKCGDGVHMPTEGNSDQHNVIVLDVQEEG